MGGVDERIMRGSDCSADDSANVGKMKERCMGQNAFRQAVVALPLLDIGSTRRSPYPRLFAHQVHSSGVSNTAEKKERTLAMEDLESGRRRLERRGSTRRAWGRVWIL